MGYKVRTYSLAELKRISTPREVVPTFFWLIPVGKWDYHQLEELWCFFTKHQGVLNDLGLMIVKEDNLKWQSDHEKQHVDLSIVAGQIEELLPSVINSIYGETFKSALNKQENNVLILSGAFPQPGWGVLISFNKISIIKKLIVDTLDKANPEILEIFKSASVYYKRWCQISEKPILEDTAILKQKHETYSSLLKTLKSIVQEIESEEKNTSYYIILKRIQPQIKNEAINDRLRELVDYTKGEFIAAISVMSLMKYKNEGAINQELNSFLENHNPRNNNLFDTSIDKKIKKTASLLLKLGNADRLSKDIIGWANVVFSNKITIVKKLIKDLIDKTEPIFGGLVANIDFLENTNKKKLEDWEGGIKSLRPKLQSELENVLSAHWEYGPRFLLELELAAKKQGHTVKSISWDHPRMIGWKLFYFNLNIKTIDITYHINKIIKHVGSEPSPSDNNLSHVNGSLFTDYVHYLSTLDTSLAPRDATIGILNEVLRNAEIIDILKFYGDNVPHGLDKPDLIEKMLVHMGWPYIHANKEVSLAECIVENYEGNKSLKANDVRIVCESYCKDLIAALSKKLNYNEEEVLNVTKEKYPNFKKPRVKRENNNLYVTIGSSVFVINSLLENAYPDKSNEINKLVKSLNVFNDRANNASHHPYTDFPIASRNSLIKDILDLTHAIVGEMPWHFYPVQRNGKQPYVLTGNSWSHSHRGTRQLSVIIWTDDRVGDDSLIWNPLGTNPVIPDGVVINNKKSVGDSINSATEYFF